MSVFQITPISESQNLKATTANENDAAIETAMSADVDFTITTDTTVTDEQYASGVRFTLGGTPASAFTFDLPEVARMFMVTNESGQQATVRCGTNTGDTVAVPTGANRILFNDGTGIISFGGLIADGVDPLGVLPEASLTRSLTSGDEGSLILMNNDVDAATFTFVQDSVVNLAIGSVVTVVRMGTGTLTVVQGTGVTLQSATALTVRAQYSSISGIKTAANTWLTQGDFDLV